MAYKDPKRRNVWLNIWCKEIEKAEVEFPILYQIDEIEEQVLESWPYFCF